MRKLLSLILALLLCLTLCACAKDGINGPSDHTHEWIDSSDGSPRTCRICGGTEQLSTEPSTDLPPEQFPGVTVSMLVYLGYADEDQDNLWLYQKIEERFGCNIEIIEVDTTDAYHQKMTEMLTSGTLPTIFTFSPGSFDFDLDTYYFTALEEIMELGEQGKLVDVMAPENLAKMPNFAKLFVEDTDVYRDYMLTAAEDGSHYLLPAYDCSNNPPHYWVYNEVAFKEAGVQWRGDPEGFLEMLRELKAYYPDSYPLTGSAFHHSLDRICYTYNINSSYAAYDWDQGEWYYGATSDRYYDMLSLFQTAYNEELMHPLIMMNRTAPTFDHDIIWQDGFLYHSWLVWMDGQNTMFSNADIDGHVIPAPSPVGLNGMTLEVKKFSNKTGTVISNHDPDAAACAMAIMDWMYDSSENGGAWLATVGPEEALQKDENGSYIWDYEYSGEYIVSDEVALGELYGMFQNILTVRYCPESPILHGSAEETMAKEIIEQIGSFKAPPMHVISDAEISEAYAASKEEIHEMQNKFITENWTRAQFDAWAADFNATYGNVIDYLNG